MDRKQIITKEIEFWKKNRLLPDHYCDFLLMLYKGENDSNASRKKSKNLPSIILTAIALTLFGISFIVFYFTDFSSIMQIALYTLTLAVITISAWYLKKNKFAVIHLFNMVLALLIFIGAIQLVEGFFPQSHFAIFSIVIINCMAWIYLGFKFKPESVI